LSPLLPPPPNTTNQWDRTAGDPVVETKRTAIGESIETEETIGIEIRIGIVVEDQRRVAGEMSEKKTESESAKEVKKRIATGRETGKEIGRRKTAEIERREARRSDAREMPGATARSMNRA